jgi:hypothetical protein
VKLNVCLLQPLAAGAQLAVGMRVLHHLMPHTFPHCQYTTCHLLHRVVRCVALQDLQDRCKMPKPTGGSGASTTCATTSGHLPARTQGTYNIRTPSLFASYLPPVASWTNGRADAQRVAASEQHITCASSPAISNVGSVTVYRVLLWPAPAHFRCTCTGSASAVTSARRAGWTHFELRGTAEL